MNKAELLNAFKVDQEKNKPTELPENTLQQLNEKIEAVNKRLAELRETIHSTKNKEAVKDSKKLMKDLEDEIRRLLARKKNFGA